MKGNEFPEDNLVRLKRPDGTVKWVRVTAGQLQRLMDLANGAFGDKSIDLGGPVLPKPGK